MSINVAEVIQYLVKQKKSLQECKDFIFYAINITNQMNRQHATQQKKKLLFLC